MVHAHAFKYALLAFGLCGSMAACGSDNGNPDSGTTLTYSANIQKDMQTLSCISGGCHDSTGTSNLKINVQGDAMANYQVIITNNYVKPGDAANSPMIKVPSTGTDLQNMVHVKTLSGTKLADWTSWVNAGAPF